MPFLDMRSARAFLAPIATDAGSFMELQRIAAELTMAEAPRDIDAVTERVAEALVARRITFVVIDRKIHLAQTQELRKDGDGGGGDGETVLEWIEARLLDEDGVGIANARCVVVAPDAQRHELYTDSLGTVRLDAVPRGSCKFLYPELDPAALPKSADARPTRAEMQKRSTVGDLVDGLTRGTGETHEFRLLNLTLKVRLAIDPNDTASRDDQFILHARKGSAAQKIIKTIKDDQVAGDSTVDLVYEHLWRDHKYTLEVDPGAEGEPYEVFTDKPLQQLVAH